jgi:SAM-dependent methyltransferase
MSGHSSRARSFGGVADAYERSRPGYPREAAAWLVGRQPTTVLELGAGTGKLTAALVALGHDVHATDPDEEMLARLRERLPEVRTSVAEAEDLPVPDASYDVVVAAQAFHWFDTDRALPEVARVLKPGGRLALVWNQRDERIPWVRRLGRIIDPHDDRAESIEELAAPVSASALFGEVEHELVRHWQVVDRDAVRDLALSRSSIAVLDEPEREERLRQVVALYDDYGRGADGMQLPYAAHCFRATAVDRPRTPEPAAEAEPLHGPATTPTVEVDLDAGVVLIDFR